MNWGELDTSSGDALGLINLYASFEKNRTLCPVPGVLGPRRIERTPLRSLRPMGVDGWVDGCRGLRGGLDVDGFCENGPFAFGMSPFASCEMD